MKRQSVYKYGKGEKVEIDFVSNNFAAEVVTIVSRGTINGVVEYVVKNISGEKAKVLQSSIKGKYIKPKKLKKIRTNPYDVVEGGPEDCLNKPSRMEDDSVEEYTIKQMCKKEGLKKDWIPLDTVSMIKWIKVLSIEEGVKLLKTANKYAEQRNKMFLAK